MLSLRYIDDGFSVGQIVFHNDSVLCPLQAQPAAVCIMPEHAPQAAAVKNFITRIYANAYKAQISVHYPVLVALYDDAGNIMAATGIRSAAESTLFLEQYLEKPVEQVLSITRDKVVEIGNLASGSKGAGLLLFAALAVHLRAKGFKKSVMTGTGYLEKRFRFLGLEPQRHAKADPTMLQNTDETWGSYYETQPHVISLSISHGYKHLKSMLGIKCEKTDVTTNWTSRCCGEVIHVYRTL